MKITKNNFLFLSILIVVSILIRLVAITHTNLIAEEAYYWNYANHLDLSYLDHPPMVAYLIKIFTLLLGTNEFAVRIPGIICWIISAFFSYRLTELIKPKAGIYAAFLLSILPFFFTQSLVMTPDLPLIAAWSACLYYLYISLTTDKKSAWYNSGITFGIGMLSKYTIALLILAIIIYIACTNRGYKKLLSPHPYIAALIAIIIFSPVIYWNATNDWASFLFQSTRRFNETNNFTFHQLLGLFVLFLTPLGVLSIVQLFRKKSVISSQLDSNTIKFLQIFTLTPLLFFSIFSLIHEVKFNWIGPGMLAIIPWIAIQIASDSKNNLLKNWIITATILLFISSGILFCLATGKPKPIYQAIFSKFIDWNDFEKQINDIANNISFKYKKNTVFVPLDKYNVASELAFYQAHDQNSTNTHIKHEIFGRNILGMDSLMYKYWYKGEQLRDKILILIYEEKYMFIQLPIANNTHPLTEIQEFWALSSDKHTKIRKYYYRAVVIQQKKLA